jgi:hypothetical protein
MTAVILFSAFVYLYYINTVSTQGWFFRKERRNLERVQFDYNIASLTTVRLEKQLWDSVTLRAQPHKTIDVTTRVVNLPTVKEIVYRDDH